jgi:hypothetical protein
MTQVNKPRLASDVTTGHSREVGWSGGATVRGCCRPTALPLPYSVLLYTNWAKSKPVTATDGGAEGEEAEKNGSSERSHDRDGRLVCEYKPCHAAFVFSTHVLGVQ